jgi:hypothetical protein
MIPGLYVSTDQWGNKIITEFIDPNDPCMGREVCEVNGEEDSDGDIELAFDRDDFTEAIRHGNPCTDTNCWQLVYNASKLVKKRSMARDEGVLLTVLSVMFVGHIDLEGLDAWIDGADLPADCFVAEPFHRIWLVSTDELRKIALENYEIAIRRLATMWGE